MRNRPARFDILCKGLFAFLWAAASLLAATPARADSVPVSLSIHYIEAQPAPDRTANQTTAYFTVMGEDGRPLLDLDPDRFEILEDGRPVEVERLSLFSEPMAVVLAIDTSGSMLASQASGAPVIETVKEAAAAFISLLSDGDKLALFTFDNETKLRLDFTGDRKEAIEAVRRITATPQAFTRLYDTALAAVKKAAEFPRGRRAVVLLTDGKDEKKGGLPYSIHRVRDVIDAAATRAIRVPIYTIGAGPRVDAEALNRISSLTGGQSLIAASADEVPALYRTVADQLKHPYRLLYYSRTPSGEHSLVVKCRAAGKSAQDERRFWSPPLPVSPPPTLEITSPADGESVLGDQIVKLAVSPEDRVARIRVYMDGRLVLDKDQPPLDRFLLSARQLAPGRHLLRVEAVNRRGAMGPAEIAVNIPAPSISIARPDSKQPVRGKVAIECRIESEAPLAKLRLRVDGIVKAQRNTPPFAALTWDTADLAPGGHTVKVEAVDAYGRTGSEETIFQVQVPAWKRLLPLAGGGVAVLGLLAVCYLLFRAKTAPVLGQTPGGEPLSAPGCRGGSQPEPVEDETVFFDGSIEPKAAPEAKITVLESPGLEPGTEFTLQGAVSVGRHERSDVRLADKSVSRKHAEIYFDGSSYFLRDLGSRYGTMVNRHRISLDAAPLFDGAQIRLGPRSTLEFNLRKAPGPDDATLVDSPAGNGENDDTFPVDR